MLSDLIRRAARENRNIKIAAERVRAARAGETVSRSWLLPSIGVAATGVKYDTGYSSSTKQFVPDIDAAAAGVNVSWEIDLSAACARASRRLPPKRWRPNTACGACVSWC